MWEYIIKNKEWIFSGVGVFILTFFVTHFFKRKKKREEKFKSYNDFNNSSVSNSPINNINSGKVNFTQTIYHNAEEKIDETVKPALIFPTPGLAKAKQDFISKEVRLRSHVYAALVTASTQNADSLIEIRDILDEV